MDHAEAWRLRQTVQKHGPEELPLAQGQGWQLKVPGCDGAGVAKRSYPTSKVRRGRHKEIPLIQGKEQWLHFA